MKSGALPRSSDAAPDNMGGSIWRYLRLLGYRPLLILSAGIVLAVVGEASSIALLGLSGWFIASCYVSGLSAASSFSYLTPSGGVRALALSRISARYCQRLVSHSATLRWLTRLRLQMFDDAAHMPAGLRRMRHGEALDRAVTDAEVLSETLIRCVQPLTVAAIITVATVAVIAASSALLAAVFAVGAISAVVTAVVDFARAAALPSVAQARGHARTELITAVDAWPELMSLGAGAQLRALAADHLRGLDQVTDNRQHRRSRSHAKVDVLLGATLVAVGGVILSRNTGFGLASTTFILLLTVGALDLLTSVPDCLQSALAGREAANRLGVLSRHSEPAAHPQRIAPTGTGLPVCVRHLRLRGQPGDAAPVSLAVAAGGALVLTGRSGTGKTTLLQTISGDLRSVPDVVRVGSTSPRNLSPSRLVFVEHDDYVFTGTIADNLRLADPRLTATNIEHLLAQFHLTDAGLTAATLIGQHHRTLSGGEQRRLVLARAAAAQPDILLLDEPTEGLDANTTREVMSNLRALLPHTTLIIAMHDKQVPFLPPRFATHLSLDTTEPQRTSTRHPMTADTLTDVFAVADADLT